mgnify:CR=1 FL=1
MALNMDIYTILEKCQGFQWDKGNSFKNWLKHGVAQGECEQVFFNEPLVLFKDDAHSDAEDRFSVFGHTDEGKYLFIAFTVREKWVRVISARNMNKKERGNYENEKFETSA